MHSSHGEARSLILAKVVWTAAQWVHPDYPSARDAPLLGRPIWHGFQSLLRETIDLLFTLGAVEPGEREIQHFVIDGPDVESFSSKAIEDGADFSAVLGAFIGYWASHRPSLSSGREPFLVPADFREEMEALVLLGYAEMRGDRFAWTRQIGPIMRRHYLWDRDDKSAEEQEREEMEDLLLAMPPRVRAELIACCKSRSMIRVAEIVGEQVDGSFQTGLRYTRLMCAVVGDFDERGGAAGY